MRICESWVWCLCERMSSSEGSVSVSKSPGLKGCFWCHESRAFFTENGQGLFVFEFVVFVGLRGGKGSEMDGRGSVRVKGSCKWSSGLVRATVAIGAKCLGSKELAARVWIFWGKGCRLGFLEREAVEGFKVRFRG